MEYRRLSTAFIEVLLKCKSKQPKDVRSLGLHNVIYYKATLLCFCFSDSCCERVLENPTASVCPFHAAIPVKCKPCALPFPAMPSIVHQKTRYAENRGRALSPSGKVCIESQHGQSGRRLHAEFFGGLSAYFGVFIPVLIHPKSAMLRSELGI